jgi:hypothetical protein
MPDSVTTAQETRDAINRDIAIRTKAYQTEIARFQALNANLTNLGAALPHTPLAMLAHGDSWFDYPLTGNVPSPLQPTDVIAQLKTMGNIHPFILNVSHHGDATTDEMSWPKQQRMIDALRVPSNWPTGGRPDAILFSGGGNDIAGDQFCVFLDYARPGAAGLNVQRFQEALGMVEASYRDLFAFRDRFAHGVPIFAHCYDFAIPNGVATFCAGPWLKPSLDFCGWDVPHGTAIVRQALTEFKVRLDNLAADPKNNFFVVPTQGTLTAPEWANELHPQPGGFQKIAAKFVAALRTKFPARI